MNGKSEAERSKLLQKARACGPELKNQYQARKKQLLEERADILQAKQAALMHLQEKRVQEEEKLTQTMIYGLWQSEQQMQAGLMKLKTKTRKFQALKAQLDFRKKCFGAKSCRQECFLPFKKQSNYRVGMQHAMQQPLQTISAHICVIRNVSLAKELSINGAWMGPTRTILDVVADTSDWYLRYDN